VTIGAEHLVQSFPEMGIRLVRDTLYPQALTAMG
jgi:hypothetical protein